MDLYAIKWLDIQTHSDERVTRPYKELLAERITYGRLKEDRHYCVLIHTEQYGEDFDRDFTVIPKSLIISKTKYSE